MVGTGDGGLAELADEWNSGKVLYAFVGIANEMTHLTKYVLINWQVSNDVFYFRKIVLVFSSHMHRPSPLMSMYVQFFPKGEGVIGGRKGVCANHIRDISKLLAGSHLTLNARNEDDIDSDRILEKLNSIRFAATEGRTIVSNEGMSLNRYFPFIQHNT